MWVCAALVALAGCLQAQLVVPVDAVVTIAGRPYTVALVPVLVSHGAGGSVASRLQPVAADSVCPVDAQAGAIRISSGLFPMQQAKALIHEVVHIAQTCDDRDLPVDERIAQDVADLLNSAEGRFILKELTR